MFVILLICIPVAVQMQNQCFLVLVSHEISTTFKSCSSEL
jgi:hypothetical protein